MADTRKALKLYWVVTPPYGDRFSYGSDVAEAYACNKREALVLGLRELRRMRSKWIRDCEGSPFKGLKAHEVKDGSAPV